MKIKFKLINEQEINIINDSKIIGRIFSPAGTSEDITNAIQVCGFQTLYSYWGCGVFQDKNRNPKKDIQILFDEDSSRGQMKWDMLKDCGRCFYLKDKDGKCKCNDLRLKELKEIIMDTIEKQHE